MKKAKINRLEALDFMGSEALNTICSNLSFAGKNQKKMMITSVSGQEGKTLVAMRIMETLARWGQRVVLVDCDLRRSSLLSSYGVEIQGEAVGLAHYLAGQNTLDDVIYETSVPGAYLLPQGRNVIDPVSLLRSEKFSKLLDCLAERFDVVLLDTPPVGLVVDAAEIAANCDGAVFVCEYAKTRRKDLAMAKRQMAAADCPVLGCVINKVAFDSISSRAHYNRAYYARYNSAYYRTNSQGK